MNSITKRWMRSNLLTTLILLLVLECGIMYFVATSTMHRVENALVERATTVLSQLEANGVDTAEQRAVVLRRLVEDFDEKEKMEFMLLNVDGTLASTTVGYVQNSTYVPPDFNKAQESRDGTAVLRYLSDANENVMAYTCMLKKDAGEIVALRFVTGLTAVNRYVARIFMFSGAVVLVIALATLLSGVYFIRSIVTPITSIENTAGKIAEGDLAIRISDHYNDEIGELAETINYMAGELQKTERLKNEFISSVSHELRTPLTAIKGWVETLQRCENTNDEVYQRGVQIIAGETDRLYTMVEELLDFSRMQNGVTLQPARLDAVAEVGDAVLMCMPRAQSMGVTIQFEENELPVPVYADAARLRQVLVNVLDNAVKYSPRGGTIFVTLTQDAEFVMISVTDEGAGISEEDLRNVKTRFYKGRGAVRGSGIGLAVVDEIARAHGGSCALESTLGKGTTVRVSFPRTEEIYTEKTKA